MQDALQKQAEMARQLTKKQSMLEEQAARQLLTKKELIMRHEATSAWEDVLTTCEDQLNVSTLPILPSALHLCKALEKVNLHQSQSWVPACCQACRLDS